MPIATQIENGKFGHPHSVEVFDGCDLVSTKTNLLQSFKIYAYDLFHNVRDIVVSLVKAHLPNLRIKTFHYSTKGNVPWMADWCHAPSA